MQNAQILLLTLLLLSLLSLLSPASAQVFDIQADPEQERYSEPLQNTAEPTPAVTPSPVARAPERQVFNADKPLNSPWGIALLLATIALFVSSVYAGTQPGKSPSQT